MRLLRLVAFHATMFGRLIHLASKACSMYVHSTLGHAGCACYAASVNFLFSKIKNNLQNKNFTSHQCSLRENREYSFNTKKEVRLNLLRRTLIRGTTQIVYDLSYTPHRLHQALCTNVAFTEDIYLGEKDPFPPFRVFGSEVIEKMNIPICSHQCSSLCKDFNQVFVFVTAFDCIKLLRLYH